MHSQSDDMIYKKRDGTSGISGHLFETKLISLVLFRLLHDDSIEEFYLASNMDEIEAFDDIVMKAKVAGHDRPILAFIQAKHKKDENTFLNYDLFKNFYASYLAVKQKFFTSKSKDVFFNGKFNDTDCVFILYTNAKYYDDADADEVERTASSSTSPSKQVRKAYKSNFSKKLDDLIGTSDEGYQSSQADYTKKDFDFITEEILEEEITALAEHFVKFLNNKTNQAMNILLDNYMLRYHYILAQRVVDISEIRSEEDPGEKKQEENIFCGQVITEVRAGQQNQEDKQPGRRKQQEDTSCRQEQEKNNPCQQKREEQRPSEQNQQEKILSGQKQKINKSCKQKQQDKQKQEKKKSVKHEQNEMKPSEQKQQEKWRYLSFRTSFFCTDDRILTKLKKKLFELIVKKQALNKKTVEEKINHNSKNDDAPSSSSSTTDSKKSIVDLLIKSFLANPSATTLGGLIGTYIINQNGTLKFIVERPECDVQTLERIDIPQSTVEEAECIAATYILKRKIKVPVTFGNLDLAIGGNDKKVEKRLNTLTDFFVDLCKKSKFNDRYETVTIDESIGAGFLSLTNGIGSAVGNLLVYDVATKHLKFTDNPKPQSNAKTLFEKLSRTNLNLKMYRFDVKAIMSFPKLVLDYTDIAEQILSKMVIYDKQSNQKGVEEKLKLEIERRQRNKKPNNFKADTITVYYHHEILTRWMSSKSYYTKTSDIYQQAINNIVTEPQISELQTTFNMNTLKYFGYNFSENAIKSLSTVKYYSKAIIVTDLLTLTTVKVTQYLRNKNDKYTVLDLEYMLDLPSEEFKTLTSELTNTEKIPIIVSKYMKSSRSVHTRLEELARVTEKHKYIVVTNKSFIETIQEYFSGTGIFNDERQSLTDLTPKSQMDLIRSAQVVFQGHEISLDLLVDDVSAEFIKGAVLKKVFRNETINLGESLSNTTYEGIKHLYVDRRVSQSLNNSDNTLNDNFDDDDRRCNVHLVRTFNNIKGNTVLISATPGMGKSTLLTHLSLKTKELDKNLWIVRINLLDYSKTFHDWKAVDTMMDTLETLKFICQVVIKKNNLVICLREFNNNVYLDGCTGDEWASFEINMLLHYYNERRLLLLFDGFDEICPHYKDTVIELLNVVKNYPHKHKMWVTSRPYSEILEDLERILGKAYRIDFINDTEQETYLRKCWQNNLIFEKLNDIQLSNIISFINYMMTKSSPIIGRVAYLFYDYVHGHFPHIITRQNYSKYIPIVLAPDSTNIRNGLVKRRVDIIMGTPLLLNLYAKYFVNLICFGNNTDYWKLPVENSSLTIYEMFIETKLKKILFYEKNKLDVYNPDVIRRYEKERKDCIAMHKKLGTYALLFHKINLDEFKDGPFSEDGLIEYGAMINDIRNGAEKTGLVSHVTADNIPVFIYRTLAEYFAAEFLFDVLKSTRVGFGHKNIWYTVATMTYDILAWVNKKRMVDRELDCILRDIERKRPHVVSCYGFLFATGWSKEHLIRIRSSVKEDYEDDCFDKYNESYLKVLRRLEPEEADAHVRQFQNNVIAKMKPHLKRYFTPS